MTEFCRKMLDFGNVSGWSINNKSIPGKFQEIQSQKIDLSKLICQGKGFGGKSYGKLGSSNIMLVSGSRGLRDNQSGVG